VIGWTPRLDTVDKRKARGETKCSGMSLLMHETTPCYHTQTQKAMTLYLASELVVFGKYWVQISASRSGIDAEIYRRFPQLLQNEAPSVQHQTECRASEDYAVKEIQDAPWSPNDYRRKYNHIKTWKPQIQSQDTFDIILNTFIFGFLIF
jgi:hypothetical protein